MRWKMKVVLGGIVVLFFILLLYIFMTNGRTLESDKINFIKELPIAHRGLHNDKYPENSIGAFKNAIDNKYSIELDVRFTKDKKIVVFHDENLSRITNSKDDISNVTYDELKRLKLKNTDENIPTFKEVLELVDGRVPIFIEIKDCSDTINLGSDTYNILKDYKGEYTIQSFNPFVLEWYKNNQPQVVRGMLSGGYKDGAEKLKTYEKLALKNMLLNFKAKPNYIAYELISLPNFRIKLLRNQGIPIISWTIKDKSELQKAYRYSDNIIMEGFLLEK